MKKLIFSAAFLSMMGIAASAQQQPVPNKSKKLNIRKEVLEELVINQKNVIAQEKGVMMKKPPFKAKVSKKAGPSKQNNVAKKKIVKPGK